MTDTLTALEALIAIRNEVVMLGHVAARSKELQGIIDRCDITLRSLTAPFDPEHLEGWVKADKRPEVWMRSTVTTNGMVHYRLSHSVSGWTLEELDHEWFVRYQGPIPTAHFFALLCEALGITTAPRGVAKTKRHD